MAQPPAGRARRVASAHDDRADERLEEVGAHAGDVADVVAHVVGDDRRVVRVVLVDARLDLADEVGADVGRLGVVWAGARARGALSPASACRRRDRVSRALPCVARRSRGVRRVPLRHGPCAVPAACCVFLSRRARVPHRRRPGARPSLPCVARRRAALRAVGDIALGRRCVNCMFNETPALNPTSAGSAISSTVLSFRANGAIVPAGCAATAAALPLARSRCARKRGHANLGHYAQASSTVNLAPASSLVAGGRRCRGRRLGARRFLPGWGAARATRARAWSPGDRRMRVRSAPRAPQTRTASAAAAAS